MFASLVLAALAATPAAAPRPALPPTPPDVAAKMGSLFAKATPAVRAWVDAEARRVRSFSHVDPALVAADARRGFPAAQPPLTPGQADTLAAMALYQVASDLDSEARLIPAGPAAADALSKLSERKSALLKALSSLLKRISATDAAIVANLK